MRIKGKSYDPRKGPRKGLENRKLPLTTSPDTGVLHPVVLSVYSRLFFKPVPTKTRNEDGSSDAMLSHLWAADCAMKLLPVDS